MTPEELEHRLTVLEQEMQDISQLRTDVKTILEKFTKYEAKWGTLLLIGTVLWAVVVAFKDDIMKVFK